MAEITVMHALDMSVQENKAVSHQPKLDNIDVISTPIVARVDSRISGLNTSVLDTLDYKLDAGDAIAIRVFGEDSLNIDVELDGTGVVHYPFLGKLLVSGLSVSSLSQLISNGLADGYLNDPQVNVSIIKYRSFYISGQVNNPGSYAYEPGMNVNKAITLAGGLSGLANEGDIRVVYEGENQSDAIKVTSNAEIHPGDAITIGELGYFFIDGEVENPGRYVFQSGLTLRKAIALAAGFTERAARSKILIIPDSRSSGKKGAMSDMIQPGDSITVEESLF
ncbi:MAG: SLBB domain-containing protein [Mariprofundus sp.]|nr:SLBB domain-containing protein [Mariprofundus sp.]